MSEYANGGGNGVVPGQAKGSEERQDVRILKVLARSYSPPEKLDEVIAFYEQMFQERCQMRLPIPALGLEVASVAFMHLIAGSDQDLRPFRASQAPFWVDSVEDARQEVMRHGGEIIVAPARGPGGSFVIAKFPDGLVVEFIDQDGGDH